MPVYVRNFSNTDIIHFFPMIILGGFSLLSGCFFGYTHRKADITAIGENSVRKK